MSDIYSIKPAPPHHVSSKSPFDRSTATGGTHTGELNIEGMEWFTKDWSDYEEHSGGGRPSLLRRLIIGPEDLPVTEVPDELLDKEAGVAGNLMGAIWKFGYKQVMTGITGEKLSEELMRSLLVIPGTRIYHGVKFPDSKWADVDHIIVNGNKIVIVDTKHWKAGDYWWTDEKTIQRHPSAMNIKNNMSHVLEHYSKTFPKCEVKARLLIHSTSERPLVFRNTYRGGLLNKTRKVSTPMVTPQEFFTEIGGWLAEEANGWVNEKVLTHLKQDLKAAPVG